MLVVIFLECTSSRYHKHGEEKEEGLLEQKMILDGDLPEIRHDAALYLYLHLWMSVSMCITLYLLSMCITLYLC